MRIHGSRAGVLTTPIAKTIPNALWIVYMQTTRDRSISHTTRLAMTRHDTPNTATPEDIIVYYDGAYDQAREGGCQKASFGITILTGGDGITDTHARILAEGGSQVVTDPASPVFLGARQHTNNTGELSGLGESLRLLLDPCFSGNAMVVLRPDSEYTIGIGSGDIQAWGNRELAQSVRDLFIRVSRKYR